MPTSEHFWNKRAHRYDRNTVKAANYAARLDRLGAIATADSRVLDVGCAGGEITLDLAGRCGQITGIDTAERMIEVASAKARQRGISNARFAALDPRDPSFEPGSFDVITCYSVFHLVDDYRALLRRFHELLRPGGHVLNETPCLGDWAVYWKLLLKGMVAIGQAPRVALIRVAELEAAYRDGGFEVMDSRVYNPKSGQHCILARKA